MDSSKNVLRYGSIKEHEIHFGVDLKLRGSRVRFFEKSRNIQRFFSLLSPPNWLTPNEGVAAKPGKGKEAYPPLDAFSS